MKLYLRRTLVRSELQSTVNCRPKNKKHKCATQQLMP